MCLSWLLQRTCAAAAELRVGLDGADVRAAVPAQVGHAVLGVLAEVLQGVGQLTAEVPHARGLLEAESHRATQSQLLRDAMSAFLLVRAADHRCSAQAEHRAEGQAVESTRDHPR